MKKGKVAALLPIGVFLVLYLGLGLVFEYVLMLPMGFYKIPIVVVFLIALLVACFQNRALSSTLWNGRRELLRKLLFIYDNSCGVIMGRMETKREEC